MTVVGQCDALAQLGIPLEIWSFEEAVREFTRNKLLPEFRSIDFRASRIRCLRRFCYRRRQECGSAEGFPKWRFFTSIPSSPPK